MHPAACCDRYPGAAGRCGYLYPFNLLATAGSWPAAHARPDSDRWLDMPWCGGPVRPLHTVCPADAEYCGTFRAASRSTGSLTSRSTGCGRVRPRSGSQSPPLWAAGRTGASLQRGLVALVIRSSPDCGPSDRHSHCTRCRLYQGAPALSVTRRTTGPWPPSQGRV